MSWHSYCCFYRPRLPYQPVECGQRGYRNSFPTWTTYAINVNAQSAMSAIPGIQAWELEGRSRSLGQKDGGGKHQSIQRLAGQSRPRYKKKESLHDDTSPQVASFAFLRSSAITFMGSIHNALSRLYPPSSKYALPTSELEAGFQPTLTSIPL